VGEQSPTKLTFRLVFEVNQGGTKQTKEKTMRTLNDYFLTVKMDDVSTAGSVYVVAPDGGKIIKIQSVIDGTIATDDAAITTEINGTAVTGGAITIAYDSSAAGDVDSTEPTAANSVEEGDVIEIITDGASTNTVAATFTVIIRR
jgi:hypothetical protein